ncbi:aspartyl protease family protein [Sphingosinicella sp. CPCC 101087]|uniref:aspartyl protease family protein n=1 Tax=Sphingosinicella sp. CPCC 101087 TaxID=2497754 RepID=UPI00101BF264|nr:aspartyl protease family protein [Sphingosinicella sp. CPCC 101087]
MKIRSIFLPLACAVALAAAGHARSGVAAPTPLDRLFEDADRGNLAPAQAALAGEQPPEVRALIRARLAAARLDPGAAEDPIVRRIAADAAADPAQRRAALAILTSAAFASGDYAEAAIAGAQLEQALADAGLNRRAEEANRTHSLARLLAGRPAQVVEGAVKPGTVPVHYDRVGLPRLEVKVNGQSQEAVFDTGANLTVLSRETAQRLGVEVIDSVARVGNGVEGSVPVRIGIVDKMDIAGTVMRNVAVLVIDDEQLTFPIPGGYDIRAIIGFPVLRALGRIRIENGGRFMVLPPRSGTEATAAPNLRASGNDLFVEAAVDGRPVPLHLDTGANLTSLSARFAAANPDVVARLETQELRTASAGGTRHAQAATWRQVPLALAGQSLRLPEVTVTLPEGATQPSNFGTLGSNVLRAFESYTIDFEAMRLDLGAPATVAAAAP